MAQDSRGSPQAHGFGRAASSPSGPGATGDAVSARDIGELTVEIRHLARGIDKLNDKLDRQELTLINHGERLVRLEQGPTRGEIAAADESLGARLTSTERKVAVAIGVCVSLGTLVQIALSAAKLLQGAGA